MAAKHPITQTEIAMMRSRVTFQSQTKTPDGQGGFDTAWADVVTVWCYLRPTKSRERFFSQDIQYQRTHEAIIRHTDQVTQDMQATYDGRVFQVKGVRRPDERKAFLILDLEENQGT